MTMESIEPILSPDLPGPLRLGLVRAAPVAIGPASPALLQEIDRSVQELAAAHAGQAPAGIPGLAPARDLYRLFGIDPTHTRPSSEALLRRVLQGKGVPRILNAVDLCNLCSLRFLLSIGLYDAERIEGAVTLRPGRPGESYAGIRKEAVNLEGRPVLADAAGPFGNPTSDSLRTSITPATRSIWMVVFAPVSLPRALLQGHAETAAALMARHLGAPGVEVGTDARVVSAD
jgi:DNA/RNA-binding domain of Phe-tRNA-synthetase-like protein